MVSRNRRAKAFCERFSPVRRKKKNDERRKSRVRGEVLNGWQACVKRGDGQGVCRVDDGCSWVK